MLHFLEAQALCVSGDMGVVGNRWGKYNLWVTKGEVSRGGKVIWSSLTATVVKDSFFRDTMQIIVQIVFKAFPPWPLYFYLISSHHCRRPAQGRFTNGKNEFLKFLR